MITNSESSGGATLDELLQKMRDVEMALHALHADLKGSQQFRTARVALQMLQQSCKGKEHRALIVQGSDEEKCLLLIERYFEVYRRYIASPLGDEFPGSHAPTRGRNNGGPDQTWRSDRNRND